MINISMEGANNALTTIREMIVPWRRKNAERQARLDSALRQAEIQRLNGETLIARAKAERERAAAELERTQSELILAQVKKTEAEAAMILAQAEKVMAEAEKERTILRQAQIELAIPIIDKYGLKLTEIERMEYLTRLLPVLGRLISSEIEPK